MNKYTAVWQNRHGVVKKYLFVVYGGQTIKQAIDDLGKRDMLDSDMVLFIFDDWLHDTTVDWDMVH